MPQSDDLPQGEIMIDDPRADDIRELLERHLAFCNLHSPPEDVHAMDVRRPHRPRDHIPQLSCQRRVDRSGSPQAA